MTSSALHIQSRPARVMGGLHLVQPREGADRHARDLTSGE